MADVNENKSTTLFHDRLEPLLEIYEDDMQAFGRLMYKLFTYSVYGVIDTLEDKRENADLKILCSMVDLGRSSSRSNKVRQTIKANLKYAQSVEDMKRRLELAELTETEIQQGLDQYRAKQNRDAGLTADGQFPKGTPWSTADKLNGIIR